jgi:hypothetical protein
MNSYEIINLSLIINLTESFRFVCSFFIGFVVDLKMISSSYLNYQHKN